MNYISKVGTKEFLWCKYEMSESIDISPESICAK